MDTKDGVTTGGVRLRMRELNGASLSVSALRGAKQALQWGAKTFLLPRELHAQEWSDWRCWYVAGKLLVNAGTLGGCIGGAIAGVVGGGPVGVLIGAACIYDGMELVDATMEWYDHCAPDATPQ